MAQSLRVLDNLLNELDRREQQGDEPVRPSELLKIAFAKQEEPT